MHNLHNCVAALVLTCCTLHFALHCVFLFKRYFQSRILSKMTRITISPEENHMRRILKPGIARTWYERTQETMIQGFHYWEGEGLNLLWVHPEVKWTLASGLTMPCRWLEWYVKSNHSYNKTYFSLQLKGHFPINLAIQEWNGIFENKFLISGKFNQSIIL